MGIPRKRCMVSKKGAVPSIFSKPTTSVTRVKTQPSHCSSFIKRERKLVRKTNKQQDNNNNNNNNNNHNTILFRPSVSQALFSFEKFHRQIVAQMGWIRWLLLMITSKVIWLPLGVLCLGVFYLCPQKIDAILAAAPEAGEGQSIGSPILISNGLWDRHRHHQHRAAGLFVCLIHMTGGEK